MRQMISKEDNMNIYNSMRLNELSPLLITSLSCITVKYSSTSSIRMEVCLIENTQSSIQKVWPILKRQTMSYYHDLIGQIGTLISCSKVKTNFARTSSSLVQLNSSSVSQTLTITRMTFLSPILMREQQLSPRALSIT